MFKKVNLFMQLSETVQIVANLIKSTCCVKICRFCDFPLTAAISDLNVSGGKADEYVRWNFRDTCESIRFVSCRLTFSQITLHPPSIPRPSVTFFARWNVCCCSANGGNPISRCSYPPTRVNPEKFPHYMLTCSAPSSNSQFYGLFTTSSIISCFSPDSSNIRDEKVFVFTTNIGETSQLFAVTVNSLKCWKNGWKQQQKKSLVFLIFALSSKTAPILLIIRDMRTRLSRLATTGKLGRKIKMNIVIIFMRIVSETFSLSFFSFTSKEMLQMTRNFFYFPHIKGAKVYLESTVSLMKYKRDSSGSIKKFYC